MTSEAYGRRRWLWLLLAGVLGMGLLVVATTRRRQTAEPVAPAADAPANVVRMSETAQHDAGIEVARVSTLSRASQLEAPGVLMVDEARTARIGSIVEGTAVIVEAEVGDRVEAGEVLAELHGPIVHETWAAYRKALAEDRRAKIEHDYAVQADERAQRLYADKAISLQEAQRARADRRAAEQHLAVTATELRRAEETLEHLGITSGEDPTGESGEYVRVRSPLRGAVLERHVATGSAVAPGSQLFVVSDLSSLWAAAEVDETQLSRLRVGAPVRVRVAAYPGESFPGKIIFIGDALDPTTRRVRVRCEVPNSDGRLKPQMFATISLGEPTPVNVTAIPTAAVQEMGGREVVFVVAADGGFVLREVVVGHEADGWTEVVRGLEPGERVVTGGSFLLKTELLDAGASAEN
ncbi:MAG: efflux RND transporter periplasmic adaptor subunit [Thermodesulfobacteriota bacterium]